MMFLARVTMQSSAPSPKPCCCCRWCWLKARWCPPP